MLKKMLLIVALLMVLAILPCAAETVEGLPLHVKQLAPGVIRIWVGDYVSSTAVCALATDKGIVVIDTTNIPKLDQAFRKVIAKEFGRDDFKYLINTHGHADHIAGNGVYADCQIIAEENTKVMMEEFAQDIPRRCEWNRRSRAEQQERLDGGQLKEEQKAGASEQLIVSTLIGEYLESSPTLTYPTKTFTDKMTLDCGDVTFELYQAGGTHTRSDIFILVPQKGILFTGDIMADKWLTDTPGCLATFAVASGEIDDFPVLLRNWQAMLDRQDQIRLYVTGHWNGELSAEGFRNRYTYLNALLTDVPTMVKAGRPFEQILADYTLKDKFPQLVGSPGISNNGNRISIQHLYQVYSGKQPFGQTLWRMFINNTFDAEFPALKAEVLNNPDKYFCTEGEMTSLGYYLLNEQKKVDQAVRMFEFTVELYPQGWNAYDSLAEACYAQGDKKRALELYRKSVELNPNNENGKTAIGKIERELNP